jgi:hypothetical protein
VVSLEEWHTMCERGGLSSADKKGDRDRDVPPCKGRFADDAPDRVPRRSALAGAARPAEIIDAAGQQLQRPTLRLAEPDLGRSASRAHLIRRNDCHALDLAVLVTIKLDQLAFKSGEDALGLVVGTGHLGSPELAAHRDLDLHIHVTEPGIAATLATCRVLAGVAHRQGVNVELRRRLAATYCRDRPAHTRMYRTNTKVFWHNFFWK